MTCPPTCGPMARASWSRTRRPPTTSSVEANLSRTWPIVHLKENIDPVSSGRGWIGPVFHRPRDRNRELKYACSSCLRNRKPRRELGDYVDGPGQTCRRLFLRVVSFSLAIMTGRAALRAFFRTPLFGGWCRVSTDALE